jgi:alpha-L-fucosidase
MPARLPISRFEGTPMLPPRLTSAALLFLFAVSGLPGPKAGQGALPFAPTWESLAQHRTPQWYADAKFGI